MGSLELETRLEQHIKDKIIDIAQEPDLNKRLQMAKEPILLEEAIKSIDPTALQVLEQLVEVSHMNAIIVNWYYPVIQGADSKTLKHLGDLGLIGYPGFWSDGDEMAWITPRGLELLTRLKHKPGSNT